MRIGTNPNRNKTDQAIGFFHQVILPVYIPDAEGYFADGFKILKLSLGSLIKTVHSETYITVVDNGSSFEVGRYLQDLFDEGKIHELVRTTNIGKMNAVLKGVAGGPFEFITVADCDALFLSGWQSATYDVFRHFPNSGAVTPVPSPKAYRTYGSAILIDHLFSPKMRFTEVRDEEALHNFAHSIANPGFYNSFQLGHNLTLQSGNFRAVVGAGHFLVTYRGEVFDRPEARFVNNKLGAERHIVDLPVINMGLWRMATEKNYAYHMGNVFEPWMDAAFAECTQEIDKPDKPEPFRVRKPGILYRLKHRIGTKLFGYKPFVRWYLRHKGLSHEASMKY